MKSPLKCDECQFETSYTASLKRHRESVHEKRRWNCTQCQFSSTWSDITKMHMKTRHDGFVFICQECNYTTTAQANLNNHSKANHQGIKYECNDCDSSFTTTTALKNHNCISNARRKKLQVYNMQLHRKHTKEPFFAQEIIPSLTQVLFAHDFFNIKTHIRSNDEDEHVVK